MIFVIYLKKNIQMAAPIGNKNAEVWTIKEAGELFEKALKLSEEEEYDFIGEIAKKLKTYRDIFTYLSDKYPDLKPIYKRILSNLEAGCFSHIKKGTIKEASGIMNLKSNYGWTDRSEVKSTVDLGGQVNVNVTSDKNAKKLKEFLNDRQPK